MHNRLLLFAVYSTAFNMLFAPFNHNIAKIFGYLMIILTVLYPIVCSRRDVNARIHISTLLFGAVLLLSMGTSYEHLEVAKLEKQCIALICFVAFYWSLSFERSSYENERIGINCFFVVNYLLIGIYLLFTFGPFSFKYIVNEWGGVKFSMGLENPNAASIYVLFSLMLLTIQLSHEKKLFKRLILLTLLGFLVYIMVLLESRTALVCAIITVLSSVVKRPIRFHRSIPVLVMLFPVVMIAVQLILPQLNLEIEVLGKTLTTGRADMFGPLLAEIRAEPLQYVFGSFFRYGFGNYHNGPLTIVVTIGFAGLVLYWRVWVVQLQKVCANCYEKVQMIALIALFSFMVHSSSEASAVTGLVPYSTMVLTVMMIAKGEICVKSDSYVSVGEKDDG